MKTRVDLFDELRAHASQIDQQRRVLISMEEKQKRLVVEASAAQMPARRIAEACRVTVGRVYQIRTEAKNAGA